MKAYNKLIKSTLLILALISGSCTDNFKDLNTPPDLLTESIVNVDQVFTYVQVKSILGGGRVSQNDANNYCGMFTSDSNRPFGLSVGSFTTLYNMLVNNLSFIIRKTSGDANQVNKKAIARIMKVWAFSGATDAFGDIPYFQSSLSTTEVNFSPVYDTQESIYKDFFKELKEAVAELDNTKPSYGSADLMYGGDIGQWKKFANSLRLRLALRVRYADAQLAQDNLSDLQDADLITNRIDDAIIFTQTNNTDNMNPVYNALQKAGKGAYKKAWVAKTIVDILKDNNDPRIGIYIDTAKAAWPPSLNLPYFGYRGRPIGGDYPVEEKYPYDLESVSRQSDLWYGPKIEMPLMRSSEVFFALSEAALFGLRAGDANTYYQKGIDAGINWAQDFYNYTTGQSGYSNMSIYLHNGWDQSIVDQYINYKKMNQSSIDAFKNSSVYTLTGTNEEKLEQIMNQKIISLLPMGDEGWAEWRRTGYPRVLVGDDKDVHAGVSPRRFLYPPDEATINTANYNDAVNRLIKANSGATVTVDDNLLKFWWDANPSAPHKHSGTIEWRNTPWQ